MKLQRNISLSFILTLVIWVLSSAHGFSQDDRPKTSVKINLLSPIDVFTFPTPQLSAERMIGGRTSIAAEFGYQLYDFRQVDTAMVEPSGFKASAEFRLYGKKMDQKNALPLHGWYTGLKVFYWQNEYTAGVGYSKASTGGEHWDNFVVNRKQFGPQFIVGFQEPLSKGRTIIDIYTALGAVNKQVKNRNREIEPGDSLTGIDMTPYFAERQLSESSGWRVMFSLGFRIGFKF